MFAITILCMGLIVLHVYRKDRSFVEEHGGAARSQPSTVASSGLGAKSFGSGFPSNAASFHSGEEDENVEEDQVFSKPDRRFYSGIRMPSDRVAEENISERFNRNAQHYEDTKTIIKQAFAYMFIYIIMGTLMTLSVSGLLVSNVPFAVVHAVIRPSHGTLNMIIFLYHKFSNLRKNYQLLSCCEILGKIFQGESDESDIVVETMGPMIHDFAIRHAERLGDLYAIDEER